MPAQGATAAIDPQPTRLQLQRHLQHQNETIIDTTSDTDAPTSSPIIQEPQDAIIRGKVYNDMNLNGQQDGATSTTEVEPPVPGVVVKLFSCTTGERVGNPTRTNDDGDYMFTIPGTDLPASSKGCYYIQYTVNNYIVPNAIFTTPQNGETKDIDLGRGEIHNEKAGIFGSTDPPTFQWTTYNPTTTTRAPSPAPFITIPITVVTPVPSGAPTVRPTESPMVSIGTLPLPTDTVFISETVAASLPPTQAPTKASVIWSTSKPTSSPIVTVVNDEPPGNNNVVGNDVVTNEPEDERPGKQELPNNETLTNPSENEADPAVQDEIESVSNNSDTVNLKSTILIQLSNLQSEMDENNSPKITLFEEVCGAFLNGELEIATPPIYNLKCQVLGQILEEDRRLRALAESNLKVEVEVTGEVGKKPSVQEPKDVPFQELLVGTFTVQGYLFAEALKEEEELRIEEGTSEETEAYFVSIGKVRGINTNGAERQQGEETDGGTMFTKGVIAAIAVGGVMMLLLLLLIGVKAKRRSKSSSASASSGSKRSANKSNVKAGTKSARSRVARSRPPTSPSLTAAPSRSPKSMTSYVAPSPSADSEDVEIGLDPAIITAIPPSPTSTSKQRTRIRRDILAPSGKLGIMVANTTTGYGPAVHTIRRGSPMEGLIYVNDIIVAVNDVDTRKYSAGQITQVMKDTVGEERKISVLSTHR
eukprot:CAMPEP_0172303910 /NCGR_PEP_ID=MMETSP1058-20130122/5409_1 /TAXON_ID=83371 /ORGANISM="Detonula confervacea, Strain CCMP 353" /LENGTH=702 /DNA_ID=CAMNT_0013014947 /DNA_START=243 /DNA_END=2351 /DNA_ORIENTATION=+